MRRSAGAAVVLLAALTACQFPAPVPDVSVPTPPVVVTPEPCPAKVSGNEVQGQAPPGLELWGLLFSRYPLPVGPTVKIAWRMTGAGDLTLTALGPQNQQIVPTFGPEVHGGSTWDRPGTEWGSGFVFPSGGCWTVYAKRGTATAVASLLVTEPGGVPSAGRR